MYSSAVFMFVFGLFLTPLCLRSYVEARSFYVDYNNGTFVKDGKPFNYVSGSIHYFRVHPDSWYDRLYKMKYAGLDAIEIYVAWNVHETTQGKFDFSGSKDLEKFMQIAHSLELLVILRPGPYICAEWEFGGFPYWLVKRNESLLLRSSDPEYMSYVQSWFQVLLPKMKKYLYSNGGPIITVQIENEYGDAKTCDLEYLRQLLMINRRYLGTDVVYFTLNGHNLKALKCGTINETLTTIDFGVGDFHKNFQLLRQFNSSFVGPYVNTEYYIGWLDHWGMKHAHVPATPAAKALRHALAMKANVNMYMFHGGTNFGFMSGSTGDQPLKPVPTSYDYDTAISEAGDLTDKYDILRKAIGKFKPLPDMKAPLNSTKKSYGRLMVKRAGLLHECTELWAKQRNQNVYKSVYPTRMEVMDMPYGQVLYKHTLQKDFGRVVLNVPGIRDRGYVMINQAFVGILYVNGPTNITIDACNGCTLYILVENMGRVNYGPGLYRPAKGIISNVTLGDSDVLTGWEAYHVAYNADDVNKCSSVSSNRTGVGMHNLGMYLGPSVYQGVLTVNQPADTFLRLDSWLKGHVLVNNFNLGRYWTSMGPQKTLYVPAAVLKSADNIITVTELEANLCTEPESCYVEFVDTPDIDGAVAGVASTTSSHATD